jgi:hypothetical protein
MTRRVEAQGKRGVERCPHDAPDGKSPPRSVTNRRPPRASWHSRLAARHRMIPRAQPPRSNDVGLFCDLDAVNHRAGRASLPRVLARRVEISHVAVRWRRSARQYCDAIPMNDPAFIAKVGSGVGERNCSRPCFPMPRHFLGCCHGGNCPRSVAVARGLRLIALSPHSPVPAVVGGQTLGDQMVACAAAPGDQGCGQNVFGLVPGLLKQRILPTVPPRGLTRGRDR